MKVSRKCVEGMPRNNKGRITLSAVIGMTLIGLTVLISTPYFLFLLGYQQRTLENISTRAEQSAIALCAAAEYYSYTRDEGHLESSFNQVQLARKGLQGFSFTSAPEPERLGYSVSKGQLFAPENLKNTRTFLGVSELDIFRYSVEPAGLCKAYSGSGALPEDYLGILEIHVDNHEAIRDIQGFTLQLVTIIFFSLGLVATIYRMLSRHVIKPLSILGEGARVYSSERKILNLERIGGRIEEIRYLRDALHHLIDLVSAESEQQRREISQKMIALEESNQGLEQTQLELQEALNAKSRFLASISHELKTPMNSVLGLSEALRHAPDGLSEQRRYQATVLSERAQSLSQLIGNVLLISKADLLGGKLDLSPELTNIVEEIQAVYGLAIHTAAQKGLRFTLTFSHRMPMYAKLDKSMFVSALSNLISNAIKFTNKGWVAIHCQWDEGEGLIISVEDTGVGIKDEDHARIFKPLTQLNQSVNRVYDGAGIGLFIVKLFAEHMQGRVSVESHPRQGSIFALNIPLEANSSTPWLNKTPSNDRVAWVIEPTISIRDKILWRLRQEGYEGYFLSNLENFSPKAYPKPEIIIASDLRIRGLAEVTGINQAPVYLLSWSDEALNDEWLRSQGYAGYMPIAKFFSPTRAKLPDGALNKVLLSKGFTGADFRGFTSKLLVVDDAPENILVIQGFLENSSIQVDSASSGVVAAKLLASEHYDLVLLDVHMPGKSGIDSAKEMRNNGYTGPIIAWTADQTEDTLARVAEAGFTDIAAKPITLEAMNRILRSYLDSSLSSGLTHSDADNAKRALMGQWRQSLERMKEDLEVFYQIEDWEVLGEIAHRAAGTFSAQELVYIAPAGVRLQIALKSENGQRIKQAYDNLLRAINDALRLIYRTDSPNSAKGERTTESSVM